MNVTCIDVSEFQTGVDFKKVKADGISAVIIRAGYGRETSQKDSEFETHYKNANAAGLKVGAYWYSYADSTADAAKEAAACLTCIKGKTFDLPVYYDMEDSSQTKLGKSALTSIAVAFCEAVKKGGYRAGVYANLNWFTNYLDYSALKGKYSIWLAQYASKNQLSCDIWQNSSSGSIDGVSGNVDTNVIYNSSVISGNTSATFTDTTDNIKPTIEYCVYSGGRWLPTVKGLSDYAGIKNQPISCIAIKVSTGNVKYRVYAKGKGWLPWVTGYDLGNDDSGYAGIKGVPILAVQIYYTTPDSIRQAHGDYYKATYRIAPIGRDYYAWQHDDETTGGQDGHAGNLSGAVSGFDRFQLTLT